ncbi:hypothetical protein C5C44_02995 [Rathayibacter sp. AY1F6]|nr:hypothetical protein C5C44_02995 [Rathayibacter sp. AY1F6]
MQREARDAGRLERLPLAADASLRLRIEEDFEAAHVHILPRLPCAGLRGRAATRGVRAVLAGSRECAGVVALASTQELSHSSSSATTSAHSRRR